MAENYPNPTKLLCEKRDKLFLNLAKELKSANSTFFTNKRISTFSSHIYNGTIKNQREKGNSTR